MKSLISSVKINTVKNRQKNVNNSNEQDSFSNCQSSYQTSNDSKQQFQNYLNSSIQSIHKQDEDKDKDTNCKENKINSCSNNNINLESNSQKQSCDIDDSQTQFRNAEVIGQQSITINQINTTQIGNQPPQSQEIDEFYKNDNEYNMGELSSQRDDNVGIPIGDIHKIFCENGQNYLKKKEFYQDSHTSSASQQNISTTMNDFQSNLNNNNTIDINLKKKKENKINYVSANNISLRNNNRSLLLFTRDFPDLKPNENSLDNRSNSTITDVNDPKNINFDKITPLDLLNVSNSYSKNNIDSGNLQSQGTYRKYCKYNKYSCQCNKILVIDDCIQSQNILVNIFKIKYMLNCLAVGTQNALKMVEFQYAKNNQCCKAFKLIILDYDSTKEQGLQSIQDIKQILKSKGYESHIAIYGQNLNNQNFIQNYQCVQTVLDKPLDNNILNNLLDQLILEPSQQVSQRKLILNQ